MVLNLPLDECIDNTQFVIGEKEKEKELTKRKTPTTDRKPKKDKQDHLKKTPLGKGNGSTHPRQNHAQAKSTNYQSIQELPLHICKLPLNKCELWAQTGQAGSQNRSDQLPKPVRPLWCSRSHPPKAKNAKEMHKLPLDSWDRF
jgi:hypothetical protein